MRHLKKLTMATLLAVAASSQVQAQSVPANFPNKPITIVVPYPAGGSSDNQIRLIAQPLSKLLGQPIVIDNKAGASGMIGALAVARAPADGYTLLFPNNGLLIAPMLADKPGFDPLKDFVPISVVTKVPMVLSVSKSVPAKNVREFISYAKSHPGKLNYATAGVGSYGNLASALFTQAANIQMTHIPYKGEAPATTALRTDEAQMLLSVPSGGLRGLIQQGQLKLLGVATSKPTDVVPDTRPIAEALPGFTAEVWFGILAPAGTPRSVVDKFSEALAEVLQETRVRAGLFAMGAMAQGSTPEAFAALMQKESAQFAAAIRSSNMKTE
jgi:tripartite-type tricarboxylate transporter receptor subunit TctC